ncbi:MAG: hypothetical protein HUU14_00150 [Dehalococcoidia bacterium]|nr:MAG: hypothetical protein EDM76_03440 [bacterium]MCE7928664.1 hypothetical protein [Chloroflexi bacterium CFX7]MCK6564876.1 hypothetical protein [Dehalococcoidia bacterium]MCL4232343.1 hypothetical protein [Dehalococcoidia bacterium]NUQ54278.1 hypothetical protein [Dehalococcoidia bacterium]
MRPDTPKVLFGIAGQLIMQIMPEVRTPIAGQTLTLSAALLSMVAQEFDRAASRLVEENRSVRTLLAASRDTVSEQALRSRIDAETADMHEHDFHVSALQAVNDRLRSLLIDVHAAVETTPGEAAAGLNERIWDELKESTRRRHLASGLA